MAAGAVAVAAAIPVAWQMTGQPSPAADHLEPASRTNPTVDSTPDRAADIADLYVFHDLQNVNIIVTFAGPQSITEPATYDRDVLYTINISNAEPRTTPNFVIRARFGQSGAGASNQFGVQVTGLPGVTGPLEGPVESRLTANGVSVQAGLFDDPFFFDSQGFRETVNTGTLSFNNQRNFFADQNITAIVVQIPRARLENGTNVLDVWTTADRIGGQS